MANTLLKLKGTLELRARIYTPRQKSPEYIHVLTRTTSPRSSQRYALVDSLFEAQTFQPHTHDIFVSVKHGRATDTFRVFFKRSTRLAHNTNFGVRGDVVIMRSAKNARHSVVNFRGASDARLADYVLKQYAFVLIFSKHTDLPLQNITQNPAISRPPSTPMPKTNNTFEASSGLDIYCILQIITYVSILRIQLLPV